MKAKDKIKKISELLKNEGFSDTYVTKANVLKEMADCTLSEIAEALKNYANTICGILDILEEE